MLTTLTVEPSSRLAGLIALTFILTSIHAHAQVIADTARGLVGDEVRLALRTGVAIDSADSIILRGTFLLSNPTVFYPERFIAGARTSVRTYEIVRTNDSVYSFSVVLALIDRRIAIGDTLCVLAGEALAGFDTVCTVEFSGLRANDGPLKDAVGVIVTHSVGTPSSYVRHATLEQGYPNPAQRYQTVTWAFRIDKESAVSFAIYDLNGQRIANNDLGRLAPGIYTETFNIGYDVPTAPYLVELTTNTGIARGWMHVVK